jgi:vacuolar-type H+-ATPase subunit I/STV1
MDLKEQILVALGINKEEKTVKLAWQSKSDDGGTIYVSTAEELENGVDISVLTEDGTTIKLPAGTYKTEDGVSFRVEDEGIVAEVMESETEEKEEAKKEDKEEYAEELGEDTGEDDDEVKADDWAGMEKRVKNLEDAIADLKREIGETGDVEEMSEETVEEVSDKPKTIKTTEVVEFTAEEVEAIKAENEKLKTELSKKPADTPVNTNKFSSEKTILSKKDFNKLSKRERFLYNLNNN